MTFEENIMKKMTAVQSLLGLLLGFSATHGMAAQGAGDFYFSLGAGYQQRSDASDSAGTATFENGSLLSGAVGYRFSGHRLELEGSYLANDLESEDPSPTPLGDLPKENADGDSTAKVFMLNFYHDFQPISGFTPYAGIGLGAIKGKINGLTTPGLQSVPAPYGPILVNAESNWTFAHQIKLGASYALNPRTDIVMGYRYFRSDQFDYYLNFSGETIHPRAELHAAELGVRFHF
jgi:opacity protein-like surface antigen